MIRQIGDRTKAAPGRELDRPFVAPADLGHADRAAIARALVRFRDQLLHRPRNTVRAAAAGDDTVGGLILLDAARRLFGLADPSLATSPSDLH